MKVNVHMQARGRIGAIVHTGHEYDAFGNIITFGKVLRKHPLNNNKITFTGFGKILQGQGSQLVMVAGSGNTAPTESDTTLVSYLGKSATLASQTTTRSTTPDVNNEVWWRTTYRITFGPGTLGGGSVNVAEAGISTNINEGSVTSSTPLCARGLLVDGGGTPTTVSVDNDVEYLDLIWEYTEWVKASVVDEVSFDVDGVPTVFDFEVRPYWFDNTGGPFNFAGWGDAATLTLPGYVPVNVASGYGLNSSTCAFDGALGSITGNHLGTATALNVPNVFTSDTYVANSNERTFRTTWLPVNGNIAGGIDVIRVNLGHASYQVGFSPAIAKVNTKQLDIYWTFSMGNR